MSEVVTWIDPGGTSWPFDGSGNYLAIWDSSNGRKGAFAPSTQIITQEVPLQPGARLRQVKTVLRTVIIAMVIRAASESQFTLARRALRNALNPNRGTGTLQIQAPDGTTRILTCYCDSGFEGDESDNYRGPGWTLLNLSFTALDPYFYDTQPTLLTFNTGLVNFFTNPFLPVQLSGSGIASSFTVTNAGDVQCWPVWTIVGPGSSPVLTNNTTGLALDMTGTSITAGETITIDTRPFGETAKTVYREDGSLHYDYLSFTSSLWPLIVGGNNISLSMSGTTSASSLTLQYQQAYEGY